MDLGRDMRARFDILLVVWQLGVPWSWLEQVNDLCEKPPFGGMKYMLNPLLYTILIVVSC